MIRKWIRRMIAEELKENALEYVDHDEIAESIDLQALAGHIDTYDVGREMDPCDVAEHVDIYEVAENIDLQALAGHIHSGDIAEHFNSDEVVKHVCDMMLAKKKEEEE